MKVFYSILYASIKPIANEQLSIGFFMSDSSKTFFHFSNEKINFSKKLLSASAFNMLKNYLEGLDREFNSKSNNGDDRIIPLDFNYLSNYSNNIVSFSKPTPINIELSQNSFEKLFEKFVFRYEKRIREEKGKTNAFSIVKKELYPKIENHVNLDKTLTQLDVPSLIIPKVKVNFIGRNERPVAGDAINFEAGTNALTNQISHFISLIKAFELEKKTGKYFVIGNEPSKIEFPEQHSTWEHFMDSKIVEFVPLNEMDKISEYMDIHNVQPFVKEDRAKP
jgi:hypothetical protein